MKKQNFKSYYDVLSIKKNADDRVVRTAYYNMARRWHPDNNQTNKDLAERNFQVISAAYTHLKTAPQRQAYNRYLKTAIAERTPVRPAGPLRKSFIVLKEIFWPLAPRQQETGNG